MSAGTMALAGLMLVLGANPPEVAVLKDRAIKIPINVVKPESVRELQLFLSIDQGKTWRQEARATPKEQFFPFYAPQDGVYWFQMCVVGMDGKASPPDLNQQPPALIIHVDTLPPVLRITSADRVGDEIAMTWQIQETYPELDTLRLEYRPAGDPVGQWFQVQLTPMMSGQTRFRPTVGGPVQVRMMIQDSAGNQAQAMQVVGDATGSTVAAKPALPAGGPALTPPPADTPPPSNLVNRSPEMPRDVQPAVRTETMPPVAMSPRTNDATPRTDIPSGITPVATSAAPTPPAAPAPRQDLQSVQLINSTQISLDYEVPRVGPSGIKSVKLYVTRDDGRTWEELAEDRDRESPIQATLPGEGIFGFRLVVESGAGLSKGPPMPSDPPEMKIEVDLTPPYLELFAPAPDPNNRDTLILRWNATDRKMPQNPIALEYSTSKSGPWAPITPQPIPNTGTYSWKLSARLPYKVYIRVIARDLAGNVESVMSPEPQLIDLTKPEGHLIGIKSTSVQVKPPQ